MQGKKRYKIGTCTATIKCLIKHENYSFIHDFLGDIAFTITKTDDFEFAFFFAFHFCNRPNLSRRKNVTYLYLNLDVGVLSCQPQIGFMININQLDASSNAFSFMDTSLFKV